MADKKQFFLRLNPPRPTFMLDMTEEKRSNEGGNEKIILAGIHHGKSYLLRPA